MAIPSLQELELLHRNLCYALSDPKRLQILYALNEQPYHVNALVEQLQQPQPTISRHLNILKKSNLVCSTRNGNMLVYELTDERLMKVLDAMRLLMSDLLNEQANVMTCSPGDLIE